MSGRRLIRNELTSPIRLARTGTSNATWSETSRASELMRRISARTSVGLSVEQRVQLGVAQHLGVVLQDLGDLLLLTGGDHAARLGLGREAQGEGGQHDAAGHRQAERQPERPRGRVDPGGLADPLLLDGGQRVVVELGHQQAQPGSRQQQRADEPPAEVRSGDERDDQQQPHRGEGEPRTDDGARAPLAGSSGRRASPPRTCSATAGRGRAPPASRCTRGSSARRSAARSSRRPG